ncbi:MAG: hypothetical protein IT341_09265 [Chloroflexi bacterium]|nr:hypothetical protein [Chloroflexota bacterium]
MSAARPIPSGPAIDLLNRLEAVRRNGAGWMARCPVHEDRTPSLSVGIGDDGRALVTCHAGCDLAAILGALRLEARDLLSTGAPMWPAHEHAERAALDLLARVARREGWLDGFAAGCRVGRDAILRELRAGGRADVLAAIEVESAAWARYAAAEEARS